MTGLDTNILVQLASGDHPDHRPAWLTVQEEIARAKLCIAPQVISEFLHVSTDPKRFSKPLTMLDALEWIESFQRKGFVRLELPSEASLRLAANWMRQFHLGRKRVLDTHLAATFHLAGCNRLLTSDPDDFKIFDCFELVIPH